MSPEKAAAAAYFMVLSGAPPQALRIAKPGAYTAGRARDCELLVAHADVSREHCRLDWNGSAASLEDLDSKAGVQLNGEPLTEKSLLRPGDKVRLGPVLLQFGLGEPPDAPKHDAPPPPPGAIVMLALGEPEERLSPSNGAEWIIGRDAKCEVVLNHPGVSRRHASLRRIPGGGCSITDLRSTAGTFVNGHRFDCHELTVGDRVKLGPFDLQYDGEALCRLSSARGASIQAIDLCQTTGECTQLDRLSFTIPPSQFTGILGPSGAGKTTLLHILAGLRSPADGKVLVNGEDSHAHARSFGLVPQEDIVHRQLTVGQALRFSAQLRLPASTPGIQIQKLILQTMDELGLRSYADHRIGRLSGGQRKRVSVAAELLAHPPVLFLDEPSSGLDPATEFQLMEVLRELTNTGCTVVCTTHVMENAYLMDELIIITGGCLAFVGTPQEAREYFDVTRLPALYERLLERPAAEWKEEFEDRRSVKMAAPPDEAPLPAQQHRRSFVLPILLARQWAILRADWRNFAILGGQPIVIAALVAWVTDDESLAFFFAYVTTLWFGCSNAAQEIVKEIPIYRRERLIGVGRHAYLASKLLFLFLITATQSMVLYAGLLIGHGGTDGAPQFQIGALLGIALAAVGMGAAISAIARSVMQAVLIVPLLLIPQILLSGHPVPANEMKPGVHAVACALPTFASQTLMDVSFLWLKSVDHTALGKHWTSFHNLDRNKQLHTGEIYAYLNPSIFAFATHAAWALGAYVVAWKALRARDRHGR